jgi:hypothetical protein
VWQREVADPGEYVTLWLRDAGEVPGTDRWRARYAAWLDWFAAAGVLGVGMGLVSMWRHSDGDREQLVVCEDVPQPVEQPVGPAIAAWPGRQRWLARTPDAALLGTRLRRPDDVVRTVDELCGADGWQPARAVLRQAHGLRWEVEVDEAVAGLVAACTGAVELAVPVRVLAAALGRPVDEVGAALLPVVRDLVARGFLLPPDDGAAPGSPEGPR